MSSTATVPFRAHGIIPACLLPFHADLSIDEQSFRRHLLDVRSGTGVTGIVVNGHASEVASCSFDEQQRVLDIAGETIGDSTPLIHGVYAEGGIEGARLARMADAHGAAALLVFPSSAFSLGQRREMVIEHFSRIAEVSDLPLIIFQYPVAGPQGYQLDMLLSLCEAVPTIKAIKDWCGEPQTHERQLLTLRRHHPGVAVLSAHSAWLLSSLVLGCPGVISGAGSVLADLQGRMFEAIGRGELDAARRISDQMFPLNDLFYSTPWVDMHNRMKEVLVLLGKLPCAAVRPPLYKLPDTEIRQLRAALSQARMLPSNDR